MVLTVGPRELKNRLSEFLRMVQAGWRIVVTDRGAPVAELRPLGETRESSPEDAWLVRLASRGQVSLPKARRSPSFRGVRVRGRPVSETLLEDRR